MIIKIFQKIQSKLYIFLALGYIYMMNFAKADLLEKITIDAQTNWTPYIYLWSDKVTVWRSIFSISGKWILTNFTVTFLKLTVAISVTMLIYAGVKYILATWDAKEEWAIRQNIINIIVGIILAMSAVLIIYLAWSISQDIINITSQT